MMKINFFKTQVHFWPPKFVCVFILATSDFYKLINRDYHTQSQFYQYLIYTNK